MNNKKTIAFLTRHTVSNYGSLLQTYATQKSIEKLGHNAVCINYYRSDEKPKQLVNTLLQCSKWNKNILTRIIFLITQKPVYFLAGRRFEQFRSILSLTNKEYNCEQDLINSCPAADVYMTGSDQVWNTISRNNIDPVYFLSFLKNNEKRVSYAASFGGGTINEKDIPNITKWLKKYDKITIREKSGIEIATKLGISANQVLDPTFLLKESDWQELIPNKKNTQEYVLIYQIHPNKKFDEYAKNFAKKKGLKLYRISHCLHHVVRSGKFIFCPTPGEFLWYIKNAKYFLTDSFHGTAFAINFNTQFVDVLPKNYSERISSILNLLGLENRLSNTKDNFTCFDNMINYNLVNDILNKERKKSYEHLKNIIEE